MKMYRPHFLKTKIWKLAPNIISKTFWKQNREEEMKKKTKERKEEEGQKKEKDAEKKEEKKKKKRGVDIGRGKSMYSSRFNSVIAFILEYGWTLHYIKLLCN